MTSSPVFGHRFCSRRMEEQGLAEMGRGWPGPLSASRMGATSKPPCRGRGSTCPPPSGQSWLAAWAKIRHGEPLEKFNSLESKDELTRADAVRPPKGGVRMGHQPFSPPLLLPSYKTFFFVMTFNLENSYFFFFFFLTSAFFCSNSRKLSPN